MGRTPAIPAAIPAIPAIFLLALLTALGSALLSGCRRPDEAISGPIVLITLEGLRADVVGGLGGESRLTPHLDALIRGADWAGRGIAPASATIPSLASLWTGLRPWQHQSLDARRTALPPDRLTLPEALRAAGYRTESFTSGPWLKPRFGYARGFDDCRDLGKGWAATERLAHLSGGREFVWIHLAEPLAPLVRHDRFLDRLDDAPARLPARVGMAQLEPFFDPAVRLPVGRYRIFWSLYRLDVAAADERLGGFLDALRRSGHWDRTLLAVVSLHGQELGEREQILDGGNLGRQLVEVPLIVKLPAGSSRRLAPPPAERVGTARLWATLVEAAGADRPLPPAVAPSLFRRPAPGALSELYLGDGVNRFSWVEGDRQLLWESRFAPSEPDYYKARLDPGSAALVRLATAFAGVPPLAGTGPPALALEAWEGIRGSRPVDEPERRAAMARRLAAAWGEFLPTLEKSLSP